MLEHKKSVSALEERNMKFRFQNKKEQMHLIHKDNEEQGLWVEPEWFEDWEIHRLMTEDPLPTPPTTPKKNKNVWQKKMSSLSSTSPGTNDSTST